MTIEFESEDIQVTATMLVHSKGSYPISTITHISSPTKHDVPVGTLIVLAALSGICIWLAIDSTRWWLIGAAICVAALYATLFERQYYLRV